MDYQEAINKLQHEKGLKIIGNARKIEDFFEALDVAISAMQELQMYKDSKLVLIPDVVHKKQCEELDKYKQLGTLEEVREAMEKQKECKDCGYKNHSDGISKLNSCNNCRSANTCDKRPEYGQYCRINCYDWSERE